MFDRAIGPHIWFRLTALLLAILLGAQCLWLLLAELAPLTGYQPTWPLLPPPPNNAMLPFARHQLG